MQNSTMKTLVREQASSHVFDPDWNGLLAEVRGLRRRLYLLSGQYSMDALSRSALSEQADCPSSEYVVNALRSGQSPATIYYLLKQFACANKNNPSICTDRGKVLFIDYDARTAKLSLFVGRQQEWCKLSENGLRKYYVLGLEERHDFVCFGNRGYVSQTRVTRHQLVERLGRYCTGRGTYMPALYYSVSDDCRQPAECSQRTELMSAGHPASAPGGLQQEGTLVPGSIAGGAASARKGGSSLRQPIDPRSLGLTGARIAPPAKPPDNSHRLGDIPDNFWAAP